MTESFMNFKWVFNLSCGRVVYRVEKSKVLMEDTNSKLAYLSMKFSAIIVISPQAVLKKEMGIFQRAFENLLRSYFLSLTCLIYSCSKSIFFLHNSYHQVHMIFYLHLFFVITMTTKY